MKNLKSFIQALPHWLVILGVVVSAVGPAVVKALLDLQLGHAADVVQGIVTLLIGLLAWAKQMDGGGPPAVSSGVSKSAGAAILALALCFPFVAGCPAAVDAGKVAVCVENAVIDEVQAGVTTFEDIALYVSGKCGAVTVEEVMQIIALYLKVPAKSHAGQHGTLAQKLAAVHHKAAK